MAMNSVLTNTAASSAQWFLTMAGGKAESSISKLSSGSRIVKASDDAASLAISNKLRADISTLNQASRNASQGASLLQVASGGLSQIGDLLTRMKTLSTQVVNGTLSSSERQFAQAEFSQLVTQVGETAGQTKVNGIAMLAGGDKILSATDKSTIVGAAITSGTTTLTTTGSFTAASAVTGITGNVEGEVQGVTVTDIGGQFQIDIAIGDQTFRGVVDDSAVSVPVKIRSTTNDRNGFVLTVNATALTTSAQAQTDLRGLFGLSGAGTPPTRFQSAQATEATSAGLINNGSTTYTSVIDASGATGDGNYTLTTKYTAGNATTGLNESVTYRLEDENGNIYEATIKDESGTGTDGALMTATDTKTLKFSNGIEVTVDGTAVNTLDTAAIGDADARGIRFKVNAGSTTSLDFQVGVSSTDVININFDSMTTASLGISSLNIETVATAQSASDSIDNAINKVNAATAEVGALQSRMEYVQSNLATVTENLEAANGIFKDVDMAKEMTEFTKQQTLMQAGVAMLSQANQSSQTLMRLIQ